MGRLADPAIAAGEAANVIIRYQAASAALVPEWHTQMLADQDTPIKPDGILRPTGFTSDPAMLAGSIGTIAREVEAPFDSWRFALMAASVVQSAARLAQGVDIASRRGVKWARVLTPPSCSRCAVLAGRIYRWNADFQRHPGCDCTALPSGDPAVYAQNPSLMAREGQVTGLSKADREAIAAGADFNQIANAKRGMQTATIHGRRIQVTSEGTTRRGFAYSRLKPGAQGANVRPAGERYFRTSTVRLTPNEVYRQAADQKDAVRLLKYHGYII